MDVFSWKKFLLPYEYAVEELKIKFKDIRKELKDTESYSPIEFVTGRVKKISSIIDKAKRLDVKFEQSELRENIEDIAGIRIMCQFVEDIYTVVKYIRSREDMKVEYEKDYIKNYKESGYRSYHVIIRYPVHTVRGRMDILAEIQIRTLSMNFWATIEHSLKYKYNHKLPDYLIEKLKNSADSAFKLDEEMSDIRDEIVRAQVQFEVKSITVKEITASINQLNILGYPDEALKYLKKFEKLEDIQDVEQMIELQNDIKSRLQELKPIEIIKEN
ncbi:hypothetical protein HMPREF9630_00708 [Peptoanaerobacter stomatis]|uniref:RelA/SpoT domain protein n=1 Tax=Peptoanaerobacter stomatis TaxID=796937 RepID=J5UMD5_9FIRM|nr:GTP pyrophosphokinase family protein [Peptoanaerobacter stomatis]EHL15339.1 hypothetical protein HMPREF9630_00708 [Peptoanaerobacter stomatis]EJU23619.1 RelA/SpoT domain protein [Peptoanaerobacter stomatis]NWO24542.1 GTP pyrophosphokinase family protein [Peptostreptococcaceae bacterium oral taxon 081]